MRARILVLRMEHTQMACASTGSLVVGPNPLIASHSIQVSTSQPIDTYRMQQRQRRVKESRNHADALGCEAAAGHERKILPQTA